MKKSVAVVVVSLIMALMVFVPRAFVQTGHQVVLTWGASPSTCVTSVNIHRVQTSGTETTGQPTSNYAVIPVGTTTYTDTAVTQGQTYYYTASSYGSTCGESVMTAEQTVSIPADKPLPPTNLKAVGQ